MKIRRFSKVFLAISGQLGIIGLQLLVSLGGEPTWSGRFAMLTWAPFAMYVIWRLFLNPYVKYGEREVVVNNAFSRYTIPYAEISSCGGNRSLVINTRGHGKILVDALDASFLWKGKRDSVALELMKRKEGSKGAVGEFRRVVTLGFPEILVLALTVLFCLLLALSFGSW
ncbi:hypothetical protein [Planotetraspora mira]|nr:hypothetical protein [Planotetraspora mira]